MWESFDASSSSPFDKLPNEVIEHIFTSLDLPSLKNSLLVNIRWKNIISESPKVMKLLPLTVRSRGAENREIETFKRRYQKIKFSHVNKKITKYVTEALTEIGKQVKCVKFVNCEFGAKVLEAANCFPLAEKITVKTANYTNLPLVTDVQLDPALFTNLKTLRISQACNVSLQCSNDAAPFSCFSIRQVIKSFAGMQIHEIIIHPVIGGDWHHFMEFLSSQVGLKKLKVTCESNIPTSVQLQPLKSAVKELDIMVVYENSIASTMIHQFVKLFTSVVVLSLSEIHSSQLLETILRNFKLLQNLYIYQIHVQHEKLFSQLPPNRNLEKMTLTSSTFASAADFTGFFSLFPSLRILQFSPIILNSKISAESVRTVTSGLKKLMFLILNTSFEFMQHAAFEALRAIAVNAFDGAEEINWAGFAQRNPSLELLVIEFTSNGELFNFDALISGLRGPRNFYIILSGDFKLTKQHLLSFKKQSAASTILEVPRSCLTVSQAEFAKLKIRQNAIKFVEKSRFSSV